MKKNYTERRCIMKELSRRSFITAPAALAAACAAGNSGCSNREEPEPAASLAERPVTGRVIDTHMHLRPYETKPFRLMPERVEHCFAVQDDNFISYSVNIGITGDDFFYPLQEMLAPYKNRIGTMYALDWDLIQADTAFFDKAPDMLERAVEAGAIGIKCFKDLGLTVRDRDGSLFRVDDRRLYPVWERAEKLGIVVAFHVTDPVAFFAPWNPENERWEELELHPNWSFADRSKYPEREAVLLQRDRVIKDFPNIIFQCCHVANNSEDIDALTKRFEEMPNLYADVSARLGELGRHPADKGHAFFTTYQDRIMFGTDHMFAARGDVQGAGPMREFSREEDKTFYNIHWRYFQTRDKQFDHPTPIQGGWKIDGIGLDRTVLEKLYWKNAYDLYKLERFGVA